MQFSVFNELQVDPTSRLPRLPVGSGVHPADIWLICTAPAYHREVGPMAEEEEVNPKARGPGGLDSFLYPPVKHSNGKAPN